MRQQPLNAPQRKIRSTSAAVAGWCVPPARLLRPVSTSARRSAGATWDGQELALPPRQGVWASLRRRSRELPVQETLLFRLPCRVLPARRASSTAAQRNAVQANL